MALLPLLALLSCVKDEPPETLSACHADEGDETRIQDAAIEGDELVLLLGYGGGCESHDFVLCWPDQAFAESAPVQAFLELWHDAHGDPCDAWLEEERRFDLRPLAESWAEAYGSTSGTIVVHIGDFSLDYSF